MGVAALLLAGCAKGASVVAPSGTGEQATPPGELLLLFRAPQGAVRLGGEPSGVPEAMKGPMSEPAVDHLLLTTSWWTVGMTPQQVESWLLAHPPAGSTPNASMVGGGSGTAFGETFALPDQGAYQERSLATSATAWHGGALLRVDAMEVRVGVRSARNEVPSGVTRLKARTSRPGPGGSPVTRTTSVTDVATVRRIAALTNGLPPLPPGIRNCPMDNGGRLTLDFYTPNSPTPAATVTVGLSGCRDATVTTPQDPAGTGLNATPSDFGDQVLRLLDPTL
ncbi:hypothetical protein [Streptacidiphilus jiangxiensis]|uniref:hypothetical protein n=1 Tax=Streptacidiphilus jiangxiensis TaxID=235985 RepID=UPI000A97F5F8|nr:hypothetical protein [Streptacidiphilus jiangxiensis]